MAIPVLAARAAQVGMKYAPSVASKANELLKKVTSGRVTDVAKVAPYVGNSAERLTVVSRAMVQAGFSPDDVMPADLIGNNEQLQQVRQSLYNIVSESRDAYDAGTQQRLKAISSPMEAANDTLKAETVEAVRRVYGSADVYFLCHPNGGVPRSWFAWYDALFRRRR